MDTTRETDNFLFEGVTRGDVRSFERLFRAYYSPLCDYCQGIVGEETAAEDLVEEVFAYLWKHRETIQLRASARAYLYAAARHGALNLLKRRAMERAHSPRLAEFITYLQETEYSEQELSELAEARRALDELPARCREIFLMNCMEDKTYKEIAGELRLSVNTVKSHLSKAHRRLRERLGPRSGILFFLIMNYEL
ncbi:MAG: RNA polymerase sigma-70 factor [Odoribacteraceae bacterium]|jgi:RNA polymerase sigma-70 factor (ECF subfamily)|nr:RNA polymerase sigma-70 factor [Odoribacteraceae bacterium]